jgi:hypothetical protein
MVVPPPLLAPLVIARLLVLKRRARTPKMVSPLDLNDG